MIFNISKFATKQRSAFEIKNFYAQCLFLAVLVELVLVAPVLIALVLQLLELLAPLSDSPTDSIEWIGESE